MFFLEGSFVGAGVEQLLDLVHFSCEVSELTNIKFMSIKNADMSTIIQKVLEIILRLSKYILMEAEYQFT